MSKSKADRKEWRGTIEPGIRRHTKRDGTRCYLVQLQVAGTRRARLCATLAEAVALKAEWLAGGIAPRDAAAVPDGEREPTVEDALRDYQLARPPMERDATTTIATLRASFPELLALPVALVDADHFAEYRQRREAAGKKLSGIGSHMGLLRAAVRHARPDFHLPRGIMPRLDMTRHHEYTEAELERAFLATPEPIRTMARLASVTLMRQGEIRTLRREQVDLRVGTIVLHRAKAGPRVVPLGARAVAILREHMAQHEHAVIFARHPRRAGRSAGQPYTPKYVSEVWHRTMQRIGKPGYTFHDLRHHAAMVALAHGASFPELQALGGWASPKMVNRYATASNDRLRDLQDRIATGRPAPRPAPHARRARAK
jgi:integrase